MQLIQTVVVKQVLTEKSKEQLYEKFQGRMLQLKKESDQLLFEQKRLEKTKNFSSEALKKKFETEIRMRKEKMKLLEFQMEQLHNLPLGSEIQESEVQALVEVNVGDQWDDSVGRSTIIIEDGKIKEIR
ncbi:YlqD family protein [Neobacillus cucumis]|uniref:YlqD family protein n=1 Tax=Neobacillus cucumis TaxID=1740721 RepID=UPI002040B6B6|nr:YlqD family protein [Neobacillus cucumis]MCM3725972.1 YlqD family protein [Neobacillus cucumis]